MADLTVKEPSDKAHIDLSSPAQARWWAKELKTTVTTLERAVSAVGHGTVSVEAWLAEGQRRQEESRRRAADRRKAIEQKIAENAAKAKAAEEKAERARHQAAQQAAAPTDGTPAGNGEQGGASDDQLAKAAALHAASGQSGREPQDKSVIDPDQVETLAWWAKELDTDIPRLREVIFAIGNRPDQVRKYLSARQQWETEHGVKRRTFEVYEGAGSATSVRERDDKSFLGRVKNLVKTFLGRNEGAPEEDVRIFINDPENLRLWSEKLNVDSKELRSVVLTVGDNAKRVQRYLVLRRQWQTLFKNNADKPQTKRRRLIPAPIRRAQANLRRKRDDFFRRIFPNVDVSKIPLLRNKWAMRALGTAVSIAVFRLWVNYYGAQETGEKIDLMQQAGVPAVEEINPQEAKRLAAKWDVDRQKLDKGEVPAAGQKTINDVKARLQKAQEQYGSRLEAAKNMGKVAP